MSARLGMASAAPLRSTLQEAAITAKAQASVNADPCANSAANAPLKQSPAPVVSLTLTFGAANSWNP
jgi:hypothetical protein